MKIKSHLNIPQFVDRNKEIEEMLQESKTEDQTEGQNSHQKQVETKNKIIMAHERIIAFFRTIIR